MTISIFLLCGACDLGFGDTASKGPVAELSSAGWRRDEQRGGVGGACAMAPQAPVQSGRVHSAEVTVPAKPTRLDIKSR